MSKLFKYKFKNATFQVKVIRILDETVELEAAILDKKGRVVCREVASSPATEGSTINYGPITISIPSRIA